MHTPTGRETEYITTPIYYVNDKPHIGHVYTTTVCDVWSRMMRFAGRDVFFLTGTDEHGMKVEKSAQARGVTPQALADENAAEFRRVMDRFNLKYDHFIRTTDAEHIRQVQGFVTRLLELDAIYLGEFEGWYDEGQEEYYTETKAKELEFKSPVSRLPLVRAREQNYYFRLSKFQDKLEAHFAAQPDFVLPPSRRNEVLGRLREGLQDVPMSRTNFTWGIPVPGADEHVIYVWIDALLNYITGLGLGEPDSERCAERARYWPATYHVIAKDILWFHAVIWPALLMALDLPLPKHVYCHSYWISEGQKMSKSLGNAIDLAAMEQHIERYGLDYLRYYLTCQGPLGATDSDFTVARFHETYTTDLVNTVGNCASRVTSMIDKYFDGVVPEEAGDDGLGDNFDWAGTCQQAVERSISAMQRFELADAIGEGMGLIRRVDAYINQTEPYKLAKQDGTEAQLGTILYRCVETVRVASLLLHAALPEKMVDLWAALGQQVNPDEDSLVEIAAWGGMKPGTRVERIALFPRVDAPEPPKVAAPTA